jgi:quercetin dioxygenase-like cupin family protein
MFFLMLFTLGLATSVFAQDAIKADPKHYTVESENARVRVLRIKYSPGEKSVMHRHPAAVAIFLTDGKVKFTYPNGKTEEREFKAGQTLWTPAGTHLPENISDQPWEVILIELKTRRPAKKATPPPPPNLN